MKAHDEGIKAKNRGGREEGSWGVCQHRKGGERRGRGRTTVIWFFFLICFFFSFFWGGWRQRMQRAIFGEPEKRVPPPPFFFRTREGFPHLTFFAARIQSGSRDSTHQSPAYIRSSSHTQKAHEQPDLAQETKETPSSRAAQKKPRKEEENTTVCGVKVTPVDPCRAYCEKMRRREGARGRGERGLRKVTAHVAPAQVGYSIVAVNVERVRSSSPQGRRPSGRQPGFRAHVARKREDGSWCIRQEEGGIG
ncbi:hypothetical protein LX36DRAFT_84881 [Colletotrichum falcatum]|nr:hypothetical protein LX36DRAFT_84881 [Colletotrichum falcatum]